MEWVEQPVLIPGHIRPCRTTAKAHGNFFRGFCVARYHPRRHTIPFAALVTAAVLLIPAIARYSRVQAGDTIERPNAEEGTAEGRR